MHKWLIIFILFIPLQAAAGDLQAEYVRNYDGDTITVNILDNVHPVIKNNISIRIKGIDTPEMNAPCISAKLIARQAKEVVQELCENSGSIVLRNIERGTFFRLIADVYVNGIDIAAFLLRHNYAVKYEDREGHWCP